MLRAPKKKCGPLGFAGVWIHVCTGDSSGAGSSIHAVGRHPVFALDRTNRPARLCGVRVKSQRRCWSIRLAVCSPGAGRGCTRVFRDWHAGDPTDCQWDGKLDNHCRPPSLAGAEFFSGGQGSILEHSSGATGMVGRRQWCTKNGIPTGQKFIRVGSSAMAATAQTVTSASLSWRTRIALTFVNIFFLN